MKKERKEGGSIVEVDEHEKELQALLSRVMASPLTSVIERLTKLDDSLSVIEDSFGALRSAQADQAEELHRVTKQELKKLEGRFLAVDKALAAIAVPLDDVKQGQDEAVERLLRDAVMTRSHLSDRLDARNAELVSGLREQGVMITELADALGKQSELLIQIVGEKQQALMDLWARQIDRANAAQEAVRVDVVQAKQGLQKRITWVAVLACAALIMTAASFFRII